MWRQNTFNEEEVPRRSVSRRARYIQDDESGMWRDVQPSMMSDEEDIGSNTFKIHKPEWRSEELN